MSKTDARTVVNEIIRRADGEFCGKTRLFKAFYFAHLEYYDKNPGILTGWPIARMTEGPGSLPKAFRAISKADARLGS